jgi:creatinine amidohydrolase
MGTDMRWEDLTWMEIDRLDRSTPAVLNLASIEQHGPHLPVSTDATIGRILLDELDRRLGPRVLVLPQIKVCCSEHHMHFPGSLTVRHETLLAYACDVLESVAAHGFRNLVISNSHGGNQAIGQVMVEKFGYRHPECRVAFLTWWRLAAPELTEVRESDLGGVNHACEFETAIMQHGAPAAVRTELIGARAYVPSYDWANGDMLTGSRATLYRSMKDISGGSGMIGEPRLASAAKGAEIVRLVADRMAEVVESLWHEPPAAG